MKKILLLSLLFSVSVATSQTVATATSMAFAVIVKPLTLTENSPLNFGQLNIVGAGSVTIDPSTNGVAYSNNVVGVNYGTPTSAASFSVHGTEFSNYNVTYPSTILVESQTGGTMLIDAINIWTENGASSSTGNYFLSGVGDDLIRLGGTLNIGATQPAGLYQASFTVSVDYN